MTDRSRASTMPYQVLGHLVQPAGLAKHAKTTEVLFVFNIFVKIKRHLCYLSQENLTSNILCTCHEQAYEVG